MVAFKFYYSLPTIFSSYSNNLFKILQGAYDHVGKQLYLSLGLKVIESKSIKNVEKKISAGIIISSKSKISA